jgi:hypothetical protein
LGEDSSRRDWIRALSAYFRDHDKVDVDARLAAYNKAMDDGAAIPRRLRSGVHALTLQASASKADPPMPPAQVSTACWKLYDPGRSIRV